MTLTAERLRELLHYDPETGVFKWYPGRGKCTRKPAGSLADNGGGVKRYKIRVLRQEYLAHRLAWLYVHGEWPAGVIDHINGEPLDNRIANLRDATRATNQQNRRRASRNNTSGLLGAHRTSWAVRGTRGGRPYTSVIEVGGKSTRLGYFYTAEEAHAAYIAAKRQLHPGNTL